MPSASEPTDGSGLDRMYRPPDNRGGGRNGEPVTLEDVLQRLRGGIPRLPGIGGGGISLVIFLGLAAIVVIWLATGFYTVNPDEEGALRRFGRFESTASSGLHWWWPSPIGQRNIVAVTQTRALELGFRSGKEGTSISSSVPVESQMITGDENIVDVQAVVQYRITDLADYLFRVDDPGDPDLGISPGRPDGRTLRDVAETALRQVVGERDIDNVLTVGKEQVQEDTRVQMQALLDFYKSGLSVISVLLQNVNPPEEVRPAFEDVVKAQEEKQRLINLARAYENDQLPRARGDAAKITEAAEGFKLGRIARAEGEAEGFKNLLEGYLTSKEVTRQRLYLEAMEDILPGTTKFVVTGDAAKGVLPFLPLTPGSQAPAGTTSGGQAPGGGGQ